MNNVIILPIIIPLILGMVMIIFRKNINLHKWLSVIGIIAVGVSSVVLMVQIREEGIQVLHLGGWAAPFGVSMVVDMFSAILLVTSSIVSLCCLVYAFNTIEKKREDFYFYPMFLFLITGINGSFITGDIFNLFVCFEVMLIASYVLTFMGGEKRQLRESIKYVLTNIVASFLFLIAVAYLYAVVGTLNMAHMSVRVAEAEQGGMLTVIAVLFLIVFGLKAALFFFYWLPGAYSVPPVAISALFAALLTKVGIYAIFRMFTLVFYHEPQFTHVLIGVLGALTMILGAIGAVAYSDINRILAYNVIVGVGFIIIGLAAFTSAGMVGAIYYLIHDIVVKALFFLIGGTVIALTGTGKLKEMSGLIRTHPYLGWAFFIAALSLAGIPPLSGFLGKVFITQGTFESGHYWLGAIGLATSLLVLYSVMKIFMNVFWGETVLSEEMEKATTKGLVFPIAVLTALTIGLGLGAEGIASYVKIAAEGLMNPNLYIEAVLGNSK